MTDYPDRPECDFATPGMLARTVEVRADRVWVSDPPSFEEVFQALLAKEDPDP